MKLIRELGFLTLNHCLNHFLMQSSELLSWLDLCLLLLQLHFLPPTTHVLWDKGIKKQPLFIFLLLEMQLGHLPLALHTLHCLYQDQRKVIWNSYSPNHHRSLISSTCTITHVHNILHVAKHVRMCYLLFAHLSSLFEYVTLSCCPSMHASRINERAGQQNLLRFILFTML